MRQCKNVCKTRSLISGTTGTIFLYIYVCRRSVRVAGYRIVSKCFYAFLFRRPRGEKYRTAMLHSLSRSPTMLKSICMRHHVILVVPRLVTTVTTGHTYVGARMPPRNTCARKCWRGLNLANWRSGKLCPWP